MKKKRPYRYRIDLTDEQAKVLERALEFYTRIRNGQFKEIIWETQDIRLRESTPDDPFDMRLAEAFAFELRSLLFKDLGRDPGASYGVGHDHKADVSWDIYQTLRYVRSWDEHPEGGITVNFDRPLHTSSEPLPACSVLGKMKEDSVHGR